MAFQDEKDVYITILSTKRHFLIAVAVSILTLLLSGLANQQNEEYHLRCKVAA